MKTLLSVIILLFAASYSFAKEGKTSLYILDDECIIFIQDSFDNINNEKDAPIINQITNNAIKFNIEVWYAKKSMYNQIGFNNKTKISTDNIYGKNNIIVYKKGKPYYIFNLDDKYLDNKLNSYFGKKIYKTFPKRFRTVYENTFHGVIFVNYTEEEMYNMEQVMLDNTEIELVKKFNTENKLLLIDHLKRLKVPYKEARNDIKEIVFPNGQKISLENQAGNIIYFRQGVDPEIHPLSDYSVESLNTYFNR